RAGRDEVWLSSQNRNFKNRMGEGSLAYLASAATVAASALAMQVADPRPLLDAVDRARFDRLLRRSDGRPVPDVRYVEPTVDVVAPVVGPAAGGPAAPGRAHLIGRVQRFGDAVDTDAIIPGEFCHLTKLDELGARCFAFVRPEFVGNVRAGATIVV